MGPLADDEVVPAVWRSALRDALAVFADLVRSPEVGDRWTGQSSLPGYTVGGIAGHVLGLLVGFAARLDADPPEVETTLYADWYRAALASTREHPDLVRAGEDLARSGPATVADAVVDVGARVAELLGSVAEDRVIPLASVPGSGVAVADFVRTRFVEIVVHGADVAGSVGLEVPPFPAAAWDLAASVAADTTAATGSTPASVLHAFGRSPSPDR